MLKDIIMTEKKNHSFSVFVNHEYPAIDRGEGIYLYDTDGNRYIDASSGPITCSLGHGVTEIAETLKAQAQKTAYVYRMDFTTPELEECCSRICEKTGDIMEKVFMVSGGSEATETAIKLASTEALRYFGDSQVYADFSRFFHEALFNTACCKTSAIWRYLSFSFSTVRTPDGCERRDRPAIMISTTTIETTIVSALSRNMPYSKKNSTINHNPLHQIR